MNANPADDDVLVPWDVDIFSGGRLVEELLTSLRVLSRDDVVEQYFSVQPQAHQSIRALSTAIGAAGAWPADRKPDYSHVDLKRYTNQEIWLFDLAIDVIVMVAEIGGSGTRRGVLADVHRLDDHVATHHWKQAVRKAEPGPPELHDLRASVPHHKPHPA
jgi:hypothetical protein